MLNKNFKKFVLSATLALSLSVTFLFTPPVNAQVTVISDTPAAGFDSTLQTSNWSAVGYYGFDAPTVTTGKVSVTCDGSTFQTDGVTLSADSYGYRAYSTSISLKPSTPYVMSGYVRATDVITKPAHIEYNMKSPFGFSIKNDAYGNQSNQFTRTTHLLSAGTNSTDGWKKLDFHFISSPSGDTILDCHLGSYCCDTQGKVEFAGVTLKEDSSYRKVSFENFAAAVPVSQLVNNSVSDSALDSWGLKLNAVTRKYYELTGKDMNVTQFFMHDNQYLDSYYNEYYAWAGAPCHFSTASTNFTMQYAPNQDAVEHGQLHEIGHTYNTDYDRKWNFNDEVFTNVRATYAAVENNLKVVCEASPESYNNPYQGMRYKQFYDAKLAEYISNPNLNTKGYELYAMADVYLRMVYGDSSAGLPALGWNVLSELFKNSDEYTPTEKIQLNSEYDAKNLYTSDFKVFTASLEKIAKIANKSPYEIANYIPNGFYYNWLNNPTQYPFKNGD